MYGLSEQDLDVQSRALDRCRRSHPPRDRGGDGGWAGTTRTAQGALRPGDRAGRLRHESADRFRWPGLHHPPTGARPGAGRPRHQRPRLGFRAAAPASCGWRRQIRSSSPSAALAKPERGHCTEEGAGSDVELTHDDGATRGGRLRRRRRQARHVTSYNEADYAFVQAKLDGGDHHGEHAMFLVDLPVAGVPVVRIRRTRTPSGTHTQSWPSRASGCRSPTSSAARANG